MFLGGISVENGLIRKFGTHYQKILTNEQFDYYLKALSMYCMV